MRMRTCVSIMKGHAIAGQDAQASRESALPADRTPPHVRGSVGARFRAWISDRANRKDDAMVPR